MQASSGSADDERGGSSSASTAFAERERIAEDIVDQCAWWLARVAARTREQVEDLWAEAQHERNRHDR